MSRKRRTTKRRKTRRNPSSRRTTRRTVTRYAQGTLGGVNIMGAVKNSLPLLLGAVAAKFAAKRFAEGGGEMDDWNWKNYLLALAGGMVAAIGTSAILKGRGNLAQKIFEGSILIVGYKIFTTELAPKNATLSSWFSGMGQLPEGNEYGQIWQGDETDYVQGYDGFYRPIDESHRLPATAGFGEIVPATATMGYFGDEIVPASGSMGQEEEEAVIATAKPISTSISKEFENAYR